MAQLKDTLVQGSLRVTDTTYTEDLIIQGSKTKNQVLAAPSSANGAPTFRGLDATDIPGLAASKITSGILPIARGGTGTDDAPTKGGIIYASSTTTYASTGAGTSGQLLQSNAANAPSWITATNANTASTIVKRDASGNFSAGTITAALSGNASTATTLKTAREIYVDLGTTRNTDSKVTFNGGADKAIHVSGILSTGHGGTGVNSHTQNRLVWSNGAGTIQATDNHYASATKIAINSTDEPDENLYVNGNAHVDGKITVTYAAGVGNNAGGMIDLISSADASVVASGKYQWGINHEVSNLAADAHTCLLTGKANSAYNQGVISYNHVADGDTGNSIGLGLYGHENFLSVFGTGQVKIFATTDSQSTTTGALVVSGGVGVAKSIEVGTQIKFTSTSAIKHIEFSRTGTPNYICYPSNGQLAIGFGTGYDNSIAVFDTNTALRPGKNNTYTLGQSSFRWKDFYTVNGNYSGTLTIVASGITTDDVSAKLKFNNTDTTTGITNNGGYIYYYNAHHTENNGGNMVIHAGGAIILGGGESPANLYTAIKGSSFTKENLYLTGDTHIFLEANANTIANRIGVVMEATGIYPVKAENGINATLELGHTSYNWKIVHSNQFISNDTMYIARKTNTSIIFRNNATNKLRIDPSDNIRPETNNTLSLGTTDYYWNAAYVTSVNANTLTTTHASGGYGEFRVIYGTTIDYWWGVGTANVNHGMYDEITNTWIIKAVADNKWIFKGDLDGKLVTSRTLWGQNFDGSANVSGNMTNVGPQFKLPSGQTGFSFLTSGGGAATGMFYKIGLYGTYANADLTNYFLDVGGKARVNHTTAASATNLSSQLILQSGTGSNSVALEFYRNSSASWQIINEGGTLKFRNNYTDAVQTTYVNTGFSLIYNTHLATFYNTVTIENSNSNDVGFIVNNNRATNPHKVGFMVGGSGSAGIYDFTKSRWLIHTTNTSTDTNVYLNTTIMSGKLTLLANQYDGPDGNVGLDAANSDIIRVNGIYTSDSAELFSEGYLAYRSATTWDAMAANGGTFYFGSNVARDAALAGSATISAGHIKSNGTIYIRPASGSYTEGIRIYPYNSWSTIVLGGNDLTADNGTSTNSWGIFNNNGNFYITRNGSNSSSAAILKCVSNVWSWNGTATGNINGSSTSCTGNAATATRINGNLTAATDNTSCNIWISDATPTGVPRYASGFYYNPSSKILTVPGEIQSVTSSGEAKCTAANGTHKVYLYCNSDGRSGIYGYTTGGTGYTVFATAAGATSSTFYGNVTGSSASCTGNAATATSASSLSTKVRVVSREDYDTSNKSGYRRVALLTGTRTGRQFLVTLTSNYNSPHDFSALFSISCGYNEAKITCLSNSGSLAQWTKVRCLRAAANTSDYYLEFYQISTTYNNYPLCVIMSFDGTDITTYSFLLTDNSGTVDCELTIGSGGLTSPKVYGAVWNDYAEFRKGTITYGGVCVYETKNGLMPSTARLQAGCRLTSDTYGFAIGETDEAKTPVAVSGRVLVYPYRNCLEYNPGDAVCSAPGGTVDIMTREEIREYPERIIGIVSEIPTYTEWQGGAGDAASKIQVNGRIWIYVR